MSTAPLCLLQVHAHPDDESSKGAATTARYATEGVRSVLVCCTGGEAGDILNKAMDLPEVRDNLPEVRRAELDEAVKIIGYDSLHLLGYHDSGMPDTPPNALPENFANAPFDEAVDKLVALIRLERPQVIVTYGEDQSRYPHPDHLQVHAITVPAFDLAGDAGHRPDLGEPWQPAKLYYSNGFSRRRMLAMHGWFVGRGDKSPFAEWIEKIPEDQDGNITTRVDVSDFMDVGREALRAHRTQVDPEGSWFRIPTEDLRSVHWWEEYQLARTSMGMGSLDEEGFETDLFGGLR